MFINSSIELVPLFLSAWLLRKFSSRQLLAVSIFAYGAKPVILALAPNLGWIYAAMAFGLLANGIFFFASVYFVNEIVKPNERTRGQMLIGLCSMGGLGVIIGAAINGLLIDRAGLGAMMIFCIVCGAVGSALMLLTSHLHRKYFSKPLPVSV